MILRSHYLLLVLSLADPAPAARVADISISFIFVVIAATAVTVDDMIVVIVYFLLLLLLLCFPVFIFLSGLPAWCGFVDKIFSSWGPFVHYF